MNFRSISHHSFRSFWGMYLRRLSCRFSPFSEFLLFGRHAFYTVNTMVLTHPAPRKNLISISEKKGTILIFRLIRRLFLHRIFIRFRVLEYSVRAQRFFIVFFIKNVTKMRPDLTEQTEWSPNHAPRHTFGSLRTHFGLPLGSLSAPF